MTARVLSRLFLALLSAPLTFYICRHVQLNPTQLTFALVCVGSGFALFLFALLLREPPVTAWTAGQLLRLCCERHSSLVMYAGPERAFVRHCCEARDWNDYAEEIWLTAMRHPDGTVWATERPGRHHNVIALMSEYRRAGGANTSDQGFVTTHGRYVEREEALVIAQRAGQLITKTRPLNQLFSEDLWAGPVQTQRDLETQAWKLVQDAELSCKVVTIETVATQPLEMGSYDMIPSVRDSLAVVRWKMDQERQAKAAAVVPSPESIPDASHTPAETA